MKTKNAMLIICVLLLNTFYLNIFGQCPGCIIDPTYTVSPAAPSIRPDTLPDGHSMQYYDATIDFYLPAQFQHSSGTNVTLTKLEVLSVVGLPFGLSFESSSPNNTFFPSQNPPSTEHGCAKICGVPLFAGQYNVVVFVRAYASTILGNQISDDSFILPLTILPGSSGSTSFTVSNTIGCGSVTASFQTNFSSNGISGYSYSWDFGNGTYSQDEVPQDVTYNTPGQYEISCETIIDTLNFNYLTNITVVGTSCTDFLGTPDLYVILKNAGGNVLHKSNVVDNQNPPVSFTIPNIQLFHNQNYSIEVWDEDLMWDEHCRTFQISGSNPGSTMWAGSDGITFTTHRPNFTYNDTVIVTVFPEQTKPIISAIPGITACNNDSILLTSDSAFSYQWFNDTLLLFGADQQDFYAHLSGNYFLVVTDSNGCQAKSDTLDILFYHNPPKPTFWRQGDTLQSLSVGFDLQWFFNGDPIIGATGQTCHISDTGYYKLAATSIQDCTTFSDEVYYQPLNIGIDKLKDELITEFALYPNPSKGKFNVHAVFSKATQIKISIFNLLGVLVYEENVFSDAGVYQKTFELFLQPSVYIFEINSNNQLLKREKFIVK